MEKQIFKDHVSPMLKILKEKADGYNLFIRLHV
jgi:hypothetical protein